jgi:hypothetical protein
MKKLTLIFIALFSFAGAHAQQIPKATMYGIADSVITVSRLTDSIDRLSPQSFIKAKNAVVLQYIIAYVPARGNGYITQVTGKAITNDIKAILKKASPGDWVYISHVKMVYLGKEVLVKESSRYLLQ